MKLLAHETRSMLLPAMLGAWLVLAANVAWASDASERARISQARAEADAVLASKQTECQQRFAVNDCLLEARKEHRAAVDPLRKALLALDDKQRRQRGADRIERTRAKSEALSEAGSGAASGVPAAGASGSSPRPAVRPRIRSVTPAGAASAPIESPSPASAPLTVAPDQPVSRKAVPPQPTGDGSKTERVRQAEARRQSVLQKNAERDAKKPPAKPLPVPAP